MKPVHTVIFLVVFSGTLAGASFAKPPPAPTARQQYMMGYQAGRRDERAELCNRFEKHKDVVAGVLGAVRMALIHAFCAMRS
jgi:hypothetical protein